ncbi:AI-2E family transporter [Flavobacterium sp.]
MTTSKTIASGIVKAVGILLVFSLLMLFFYKIQTVLLYLIIALILSLIANPIVEFLKRKLKFKNTLAVLATLVLLLLFVLGILAMFVPLVISQSSNLSLLKTAEIEKNIIEISSQFSNFLKIHHIESKGLLNPNQWLSKIDLNLFTNFFNSLLTTVSNIGVGLASVFFITFFFLKDKSMFLSSAKAILPDSHEDQILNSVHKINNLLSRYFIGLIIQLVLMFISYLIILLVFGIDNAVIIALICAILNIIPYIGPLIATVLAVLLTMMGNMGGDFQTETLPTTIYVLIGFFVAQIIDNNISQPIIFSNSVKSHPLEIFLVILIGGFIFGIIGMIVAVPFYTILKVIGKEFFPENKIIQLVTKNI